MNFHVAVRFLPFLLSVGSYALEYSLLENLEMACPSRDNCMRIEQHRASFANRSCECDSLCHDFQDCCIDRANLAFSRTNKYHCMTFGDQNKVGVYAIDTCPPNYRDSSNLRGLCQEGDDLTDPMASAPVTAVATGTTYKNRYCAECNSASPTSLESWLILLNCDPFISLQLNDSFIWQNLKYNRRLRAWGVELDDEFHKCDVIYEKPEDLTAVRFCRTNTIDKCPTLYLRTNVKRLCESYSAVVYDAEGAYKNPHCAICNNRKVKELSCLNPELLSRSAPLRFPFTFLISTDLRPRNLTEATKDPTCSSREKYDPFFKKCRAMTCAIRGYKLINGRCRKE